MFLLIQGLQEIEGNGNPISIHLMFLLIFLQSLTSNLYFYFNTSHVSINLSGAMEKNEQGENFNTSHVSINQSLKVLYISDFEIFQYISCFY